MLDDFPIQEGEPFVLIPFSENPAFYSLNKKTPFSVSAAEAIFRYFNAKGKERPYYDKTDFVIHWTDKNGEKHQYFGNYLIGRDADGLIAHIRAEGEFLKETGYNEKSPTPDEIQTGNEVVVFADILEQYTPRGRIISM